METMHRIVSILILSSAVLVTACGDRTPTAPSPAPPPAVAAAPPPVPSPTPEVSQLVGVWSIAVRPTEVTGGGCVADTMRSQMAAPVPYSLSIAQKGHDALTVTLRSASGDRACTFTPRVDANGFTTYQQPGYYSCEQWHLPFRCNDGTQHDIFSLGEDIAGRVSGSEISGTWDAAWFDGPNGEVAILMKAQFSGHRQ